MHSHFTNLLLDLKELFISHVEKVHDDFFIYVQPIDYLQPCPQCQGENVIRKGSAYLRKVRHLPAFGHRVFLFMPAIRMMCKHCEASLMILVTIEVEEKYGRDYINSKFDALGSESVLYQLESSGLNTR
jgi:transposase